MQGEIIGAIQVLNKKSGHFSTDDEALLAALTSQAAVAIGNADLDRKLYELNQSLEEKVQERTADLVRANERLSVLNKELEEIAITDSLTQAFNRQYFMDRLKQEVKRAHRYGVPVSLLLMDIDHFKQINDTHGHQAGDAVLVGMSCAIKDQLRETDLFARYGGEEFCIIATAMDEGEAVLLADRLRTIIARTDVEYRGTHIKITVSIGVSAWEPSVKDDFEALIRRADAALYRAKEQGRNRVCS
jgi:diguanylate cyclase (GGDEF)-like protein